ncbi:Lhr-like helicase [Snodgrassella alvi SCGC AB-598-O11]|nr:Lhr-like helicase [Snodgrassella alvi SCGC AB-598-O11]
MQSYHLLNQKVKKWIYQQGWNSLREIQQLAIAPILAGKTDVLISASTAAGKTEAAFLPACSKCMEIQNGVSILYISPLKALINDQYRRLYSLTKVLSMQLTPWHGDIPANQKTKFKKSPSGILLITPESLESMLLNDSGWFRKAFQSLQYIIIDEFHAFIGQERGIQLLSLLTRTEHLIGKLKTPVPRIALSATLGDLNSVPLSLRPNQRLHCQIIRETHAHSSLKLQVRGYIDQSEQDEIENRFSKTTNTVTDQICQDIFRFCRGSNNLVFVNSRPKCEKIAVCLSDMCEQKNLPNEFFPHHGSLAKSFRESLEQRLQKSSLPTTAICTMTLELGIDIGKVNSVIQVGSPHSVSSLRQRVGRSGRRGNSSILRMLIAETKKTETSNFIDLLHLDLIQALAMVRLLISSNWFEPVDNGLLHFSTLLHQILSVLAQWGGIRIEQLYQLLCREGPFQNVTTSQFKSLLRHMGSEQLIGQTHNDILILGVNGEKLVNHYTFYSVFQTPLEYRVITKNKTLGSIPVTNILIKGQNIIFAGQRWQIISIDITDKIILVDKTKGGVPPTFQNNSLNIHETIRKEMYQILCDEDFRISAANGKADFTDNNAKNLFIESCRFFKYFKLSTERLIQYDNTVYILTWEGDKVINTLFALLHRKYLTLAINNGIILVYDKSIEDVEKILKQLAEEDFGEDWALAQLVPEQKQEKFDSYLPEHLLLMKYARQAFDLQATKKWLQQFAHTKSEITKT